LIERNASGHSLHGANSEIDRSLSFDGVEIGALDVDITDPNRDSVLKESRLPGRDLHAARRARSGRFEHPAFSVRTRDSVLVLDAWMIEPQIGVCASPYYYACAAKPDGRWLRVASLRDERERH
jgi:hypothetical protein